MEMRDFSSEFNFTTSRSSGAGGQNVNKVNTKVELRFDVGSSGKLTEEEKALISQKLSTRINDQGELIITSQSERTQLKNKEKVVEKFYALIEKALTPVKKRKATRPTKASREKRLEEKKIRSEKKVRRNIKWDLNK